MPGCSAPERDRPHPDGGVAGAVAGPDGELGADLLVLSQRAVDRAQRLLRDLQPECRPLAVGDEAVLDALQLVTGLPATDRRLAGDGGAEVLARRPHDHADLLAGLLNSLA